MDRQGFLNKSEKKRGLSRGSKVDDESKRQREESPNVSCLESPTSQGNVFAERL